MNFATKMVHVTKDAKARPAMIACTTVLADMNIDHGDSSCSPTVTDLADEAAAPEAPGAVAVAASEFWVTVGGSAGCCATVGRPLQQRKAIATIARVSRRIVDPLVRSFLVCCRILDAPVKELSLQSIRLALVALAHLVSRQQQLADQRPSLK
jgi:hypothetical protein